MRVRIPQEQPNDSGPIPESQSLYGRMPESGQMGRTVNPLPRGCVGSNPTSPTKAGNAITYIPDHFVATSSAFMFYNRRSVWYYLNKHGFGADNGAGDIVQHLC